MSASTFILPHRLFIDNQWLDATNRLTLVNIDPATEQPISEVASGTKEDVDYAVSCARRALSGVWRDFTPWQRGRLLLKVSQLIVEHAEVLTDIEMRESGKPISASRKAVLRTARYFEFYAGIADKIQGTSIPLGDSYIDFTLREPLGVTAHILPWNVPLSLFARGVAPALAAGCTAVIKPSEQTPQGALALAQLFVLADAPCGVVNVVNGTGAVAGAALASHPGIDGLTFTGSVATGRKIMQAAAAHIKPVVLELGGKSPILVFSDANIDRVINEVTKGIYSNTGQFCDAGSRLLLDKRLQDAVVDGLVDASKHLKVGLPSQDPQMGPLISAQQHKKVMSYIESGKREGAYLACGGKRPETLERGYFVEPTIFSQVSNQSTLGREEIFGPVLSVMSFDDEAQALAIANDSNYGLAAGIFTNDINRALRLTTRLEVGTVYVNEYFAGDIACPFGGVKQSGIGRERGLEAISNYTRIKNVIIRIGDG